MQQRVIQTFKLFSLLLISLLSIQSVNAQLNSIILGRPTDASITASILFDQNADFYFQYGTQSGNYTNTSTTYSALASVPNETDITGLSPNTQYFYKLFYRTSGSGTYTASPEYTFHTQRAAGNKFVFTVEADEHLYDKKGVKSMYEITLNNQLKDKPDFMLSLGDIFGDDHNPYTITSHDLDSLHRDYRPFLGNICHSVPFYICLGNHEGENDYYYAHTPPNNLCVWGTQWRKYYYPNPFPNTFYTGDTVNEPYGIGNPENYYAWTWGDALFVVLDVYRHECDTSDKPQKWAWSLGKGQYDWLASTLQNSTAKYKFVFAHHIRGQGRGGITNATQYEWGGYQSTNYQFDTYRPGWGKPIHQLFKDYGVNIFFQGHDHVYAHEKLDSITYQAVPMAADSTYVIGMLANAGAYTADTFDGTGHLRVSVEPNCVTVDFVRAYLPQDTVSGMHHNGEVAFSYTVGSCTASGVNEIKEGDVKVFPNPAKDRLNVLFTDKPKNFTIKMEDAIGKMILQTNYNSIDVSTVPDGIYFLSIETEKYTSVKKIIITK